MKLYDIILKNTDIENFCANEKHYYFKVLKQMINLMNDKDISEYTIQFKDRITNLTVTDVALHTDKYTIEPGIGGDSRIIESKNCRIKIDKLDELTTVTNEFIELNDTFYENIEYWNMLDKPDTPINIDALYDSRWINHRYGLIEDSKTIKFQNQNDEDIYTKNINSFLSEIIEEDKEAIKKYLNK